jgi:hypothetical protein
MYLLDPGSGANLAGIYTSPYDGSINGGASTPVICDDFADETYQSEEWTTYVTSLSSVTSESSVDSTLKWGTNDGLNTAAEQAQAYEAAAILSVDILHSTSGSTQQELYSYALWALFDPSATTAWLGSYNSGEYAGDVSTVEGYVTTAVGDVNGGSVNGQSLTSFLSEYHVTIYSFDSNAPAPTCGGGTCPPPPQEFITVTTPEASTPVLLAIDLLGFLALVGFLRKRASRSI